MTPTAQTKWLIIFFHFFCGNATLYMQIRSVGMGSYVWRMGKGGLNRIVVDSSETSDCRSFVTLSADDARTVHILRVLKLSTGDFVRVSVIPGLLIDSSRLTINENGSVTLSLNGARESPLLPAITLILAVPRPKALRRLLPMIANIGVSHIALISASKVEKSYFASKLLQDKHRIDQGLIEGTAQAAVDALIPSVSIHPCFESFVQQGLDNIVAGSDASKFVAHISETGTLGEMLERTFGMKQGDPQNFLLAIGPEGGWIEHEVRSLERRGFRTVSLGRRVLRTDVAVIVALTMTHQALTRASRHARHSVLAVDVPGKLADGEVLPKALERGEVIEDI